MAVQYAYTSTAIASIGATLNGLFPSREGAKKRSASMSYILALSSESGLAAGDELIECLSLCNPGRIFVLYFDPTQREPVAEVAAACHLVSEGDSLCSEIIRIRGSAHAFALMSEAVRANVITGAPCQLLLFDEHLATEIITQLAERTDQLLLDSGAFEHRWDVLAEVAPYRDRSADVQWVGLAPWRDQIQNAFRDPALQRLLPSLQRIEVSSMVKNHGSNAACALLLAGWLLDRLSLSLDAHPQKDLFICSSTAYSSQIRLTLNATPWQHPSHLARVLFSFRSEGGKEKMVSLDLVDGPTLETIVNLDRGYKVSRPLEDDSREGRLRRHFLIGESLANYGSAFQNALRLSGMN